MKKKILSVLLILMLACSFSLVTAVPAAAEGAPIGDPFFTTNGLGEAGWSTEQKVSGEYSAKLWIPPYDPEDNAQARVVFNYEGDLNSITGVSYPSYIIGGEDGSYPFVVLGVDSTGDAEVNVWVIQGDPRADPKDEWVTISFADSSLIAVIGGPSVSTLGDLKSEVLDEGTWGDVAVLEVKVMIGELTLLDSALTTYVDDITINGDLYELEQPEAVWVATGGNDANPGTEADPFLTIQHAIDILAGDCMVNVAAGTYDEQVNIGIPLTLSGQPGAIVKPSMADSSYPIIWTNADNVTVEGFEVDGSSLGVVWAGIGTWSGFTSLTIQGNTVHDIKNDTDKGLGIGLWRWGGIYEDILIEGNTIYNTDRMGIYIGSHTEGGEYEWLLSDNITIRDNEVYDTMLNATDEIFPIDCGGIAIDAAKNCTIEGNTVYNTGTELNPMPGIFLAHGSGPGNQILSNEVYNQAYGIAVEIDRGVDDVDFGEDSSTAPEVHFNNIHDNGEYGLIVLNAVGEVVDATNNWWGGVAGPQHDLNPYNTKAGLQGNDSVSDYVDFLPWMIHTELAEGWNVYSTPIAPDASSDTIDEALNLWGSGVKEIAYYYNGETQYWDEATSLTPLQAVYIKMVAAATIDVISSTSYSAPPSQTMYAGWNLIGLAELDAMEAEDALASAYYVAGANNIGYSQVVSPGLGQTAWNAVRGPAIDTDTEKTMSPGEGYWLFMVNAGTLAGFTSTPITYK